MAMTLPEIFTGISVKHINDITECPICNEVFTDPRILPCVHTFCFECIAKWAEDQATCDKLACPLCRKEHKIIGRAAASGTERLPDLPKNSFVQKVVDARKRSTAMSGTDTRCAVCCGDSDDAEKDTAATEKAVTYCVECCQNICEQCSVYHRKLKMSSQHKLVDLQENRPLHGELLFELPEDRCDKHDDKIIELYCRDCKLPTCTMCVATDHEQHKFSDVKKFAVEMRVQMKDDISGISSKVDECRRHLSKLVNENPGLNEKIDATVRLVSETAEKMKQAIDDYKVKLLDELELLRAKHEKQLDSVRQELEATLLTLEIFKHYSEQVERKGTACDVVTSATRLHDRANELRAHKVSGGFGEEHFPDIKFSSDFSTDELHTLFGELCIEGSDANSSAPAELVGVIPNGGLITSVTSMGDDVFVVCRHAKKIDVYDAQTLKWQRALTIGRQEAGDCHLAACDKNNCVYLSSYKPFRIHRIHPVTGDSMSCWPTSRAPNGMTVTRNANVLVTFRAARMLQEFTTDGKLVREISLQPDVTFPMHAVELSGDLYGVTHVGSLHRFCVVGSDGRVVRSYGGPPGSGDRRLQMPHGVAPTESGDRVFVADTENRRVLALNLATLSATGLRLDIGREIGGPLTYPDYVHYDKSRGRLYIGECGGQCRVVVVAV